MVSSKCAYLLAGACVVMLPVLADASRETPLQGMASWYGETHRGKAMANGLRFDPDKFTAASWFFPLGTRVRVSAEPGNESRRSIVVTITDRGPAWRLVDQGRIIDLSEAAFKQLRPLNQGLVSVRVEFVQ